jgi:hypothetical protein
LAESESGSGDGSTTKGEGGSSPSLPSPPFPPFVISESEVKYTDRLYDYAIEKYRKDFQKYAAECPYSVEGLGDEFAWKQRFSWFLAEKVLPSTGKTVLEEFVERYVALDEPALARRMLQMKEVIRGSFRVLDDRYLPYVTVEHLETENKYIAVSKVDPSKRFFRAGDVINSRIRPWDDRFYMFEGILTRSEREEDVARRLGLVSPQFILEWFEKREIRKFESILINPGTRLRTVMSKYPSQWVDGMCTALGIGVKGRVKREKIRLVVSKLQSGHVEELLRGKKLPEGSTEALRLLSGSGWVLRYGVLAKQFSDENGMWWNEKPPKSDIGLLKLHGLVVVGRMLSPKRFYKVAVVPVEVRAQIERFFTPSEQESLSS